MEPIDFYVRTKLVFFHWFHNEDQQRKNEYRLKIWR